MKKAIAALLFLSAISTILPSPKAAAVSAVPGISAKSAIVIEAESGRVLFEKNADELMKIASTTKILTALVVLEHCKTDAEVEIKAEWTGVEGSSMYLKAGELLTVRELLYGLLLQSGNDAAVALACYAAGSVSDFAKLMNDKARELGCEISGFKNPHGLDADGHLATSRELALITAAAMKNETFVEIASTKTATVGGRSLKNHNRLLWDYKGCVGVKTGYTKSAGRSLVSCAERDGVRFICVTLSDPNDWADHTNLFDWAFSQYERVTIPRGQTLDKVLPVISGVRASVKLETGEEVSFLCEKGAEYTLNVEAPKFVYAVVVRGAAAGELTVRLGGEEIARIPVLYAETVRQHGPEKLSRWEQIKRAWYKANEYGGYQMIGYY